MKTKRKYKLILFSVMLILIIQNLIVHVTKFGRIPSVNLNPKVTCQVIHNHHQKNYTMTDIPLGKRGDTFIYRVPIPKNAQRVALCFTQKHSLVKIAIGKHLIQGKNLTLKYPHHIIGNQLFTIPLLPSDAGKTITIYAHHVEKNRSSHFTYFRLMNVTRARLYPLIGNSLVTLIFVFTLMGSISIMGTSVVGAIISKREMISSFLLGLLVFISSLWQLAEKRILYIFFQNYAFCAQTEYYTFYIGVVLLFLYLSTLHQKGKMYIIDIITAVFFALFIIGLHFLAILTGHVIVDYEQLIYCVAGSLFLTLLIVATSERRKAKQKHFYSNVLIISTVLIITHVALGMTDCVLPGRIHYANMEGINLSSIALMIFFIAVTIGNTEKFLDLVMARVEKKQLEHFAYIDSLTGIPNRQFCEKLMKKLTQDYAIVFLDVDYLKKANDRYGHEMGDQLLKVMADIISESVDQTYGFCGRWGGDEFIMGFYHESDVSEALAKMNEMIDTYNQKQLFPFTLSLSYGIAKGKEGITPEQARAQADADMYIFKQQHHRAR